MSDCDHTDDVDRLTHALEEAKREVAHLHGMLHLSRSNETGAKPKGQVYTMLRNAGFEHHHEDVWVTLVQGRESFVRVKSYEVHKPLHDLSRQQTAAVLRLAGWTEKATSRGFWLAPGETEGEGLRLREAYDQYVVDRDARLRGEQ